MKQTFLSFILALLPIMASADDSGTCGDNLTWSYIAATKTLSISGTGAMSYNYISCPWYSYRNNIQNVIIEYGVTYISASAFYGCSGLTSVTIPNSVTSIGDYAFKDCKSLASITIPNSVASIGRSAFDGTGWYNNQPDGLIYIGMVAYKYKGTMPNNTSIQIKDGTIGIAGYAFDGCSGLTSISIPNSVTSIGICAFSNTGWYNNQPNGLIYIGKVAYKYKGTMPNNTFIQIKDGTIGIAGGAFSSCSGMKSVTIPNSVTSIEYQAFYNCSSLTSITIPYNVASIGNGTFDGCSGLTSMKVESGNGVYDSRDNCNAIIETGSNTVIAGCKNTMIPNSVTSIRDYAFSVCKSLTSITIPNSVTSIGSFAFFCCSSLTSVTIPNSVASIGERAFEGCESLTSITIPNSVTSIKFEAFMGCSSLTSVTIPNFVTSIEASAFSGCSSLTSITIPNSVTSIGSSAFSGCKGLTSIIIPNSVTSILNYAFSGCSGLTSITIGISATNIGSAAFQGCSGLTSITIPKSVKSIGSSAFAKCPKLTDVYCMAEEISSTDNNGEGPLYTDASAFEGSYIDAAKLHVPESALNAYKATAPWSGFGKYATLSDEEMETPKCATPTISIEDGKIKISCETEGADFISNVSTTDTKNYYDAEFTLTFKYRVTAYATKAGCEDSDTAIREIVINENGKAILVGDVDGDGKVNVTDHVKLSEIIMNQE